MKKLFAIFYCLLFTISCAEEKEPIKYYSIDGREYLDIEKLIRHEAHIKEMRRLSLELSVTKGEISKYQAESIRKEYEKYDELINSSRECNFDINQIWLPLGKRHLDTLRASNGMILYILKESVEKKDSSYIKMKHFIQTFNQDLTSLDSLNNIIGYNY